MTTDPPVTNGPVVVACTGHRCSALRALSPQPDSAAQLRSAVRDTSKAVLVHVDCPGLCAHSAVAGITVHDGHTGRLGPVCWLGQADQADVCAALLTWVRSGPPGESVPGVVDVPPALRHHALGLDSGASSTTTRGR